MMKTTIKSVILTVAILFGAAGAAKAYSEGGVTYMTNADLSTAYVSGVTQNGNLTVVPSFTEAGYTYKVISIGNGSSAISVGAGVTYFKLGCSYATNLERIASYAFNGTTPLYFITEIPAGCKIQDYAFQNCISLERVTYNGTYIGGYAFKGCTALNTFTADNCTSLNATAFGGCTALQTVSLRSMTRIGLHFADCTSLMEITLRDVTVIDDYAFRSLTNLQKFTIESGGSNTCTIGNHAFDGCTSLSSVRLSNKVTSLGNSAFDGCTSIKRMYGTDAITTIGSNAFYNCSSLAFFNGNAVTALSGPFYGCTELRYVYLPNYVGTDLTRDMFRAKTHTLIYVKGTSTFAADQYNFIKCNGSTYTCDDFRMSEGSKTVWYPFGSYVAFTASKVTYTRSLAKNGVYTVCLPYTPPARTGMKYYALAGVSGTKLTFAEVATPEANVGYVVTTGSTAVSDFSITSGSTTVGGGNISAAVVNGYTLTGTYDRHDATDVSGKYILQSGNTWKLSTGANGNAYINPFRAYISSVGGYAPELHAAFDDVDDTSAIDGIVTVDADGRETWYDLAGRRVDAPAPGNTYVKGGRTVIVK